MPGMTFASKRRQAWIAAAAIAAVVAAGCAEPRERLNAPPQGWSSRQASMQEHFVYMTDNAMLAEMHVSDVHFIPHTASLNGLGARRLDRFASLLKETGGELHYDSDLDDAGLIRERIASVREYLAAAGADPARVTVTEGRVRTDGMMGEEAVAARKKVVGGEDSGAKSGQDLGWADNP